MGKTRTCGAPCHNANHQTCVCWCNGMFHGAEGSEAREAFQDAFGDTLEDPEQLPLSSLDRLKETLANRAEQLGSLHVREPYHRWTGF